MSGTRMFVGEWYHEITGTWDGGEIFLHGQHALQVSWWHSHWLKAYLVHLTCRVTSKGQLPVKSHSCLNIIGIGPETPKTAWQTPSNLSSMQWSCSWFDTNGHDGLGRILPRRLLTLFASRESGMNLAFNQCYRYLISSNCSTSESSHFSLDSSDLV